MSSPSKEIYVNIYFNSGDPDPIRTVRKPGWTGQCTVCPRPQFPGLEKLDCYKAPGLYVLFGPGRGEKPAVYVGEGDPIGPRLKQHKKPFWNTIVLFTSPDGFLTKAHIKYLEARLIPLARESRRCAVQNSNNPMGATLSTEGKASTHEFLEQMLVMFAALGIPFFATAAPEPTSAAPPASAANELQINRTGVFARGHVVPNGFLVRAGARVAKELSPKAHPAIRDSRNDILKRGLLAEADGCPRLTQDHVFPSAWRAAGVIFGRTVNGNCEWKDAQGRSLKQLQGAGAAAGASASA
jgi:hypothetical protein